MTTLTDLENRFDGPIPPHELDAVRGINTALCEAIGNRLLYRDMTLRQIRTIRKRRADRTMFPAALDDLRLYLARYRHWRSIQRSIENG